MLQNKNSYRLIDFKTHTNKCEATRRRHRMVSVSLLAATVLSWVFNPSDSNIEYVKIENEFSDGLKEFEKFQHNDMNAWEKTSLRWLTI